MKKAIFTLLLFSSFKLYALGVNISVQEIYKNHSSSIDKVFICGEWNSNKLNGKYKITHAFLYAQSFIYIEAVTFDNNIGSYKSINSISINEYNNDHADVSLENIKCHKINNGVNITAEAYYGHENIFRNIEINIKGSGTNYVLQEKISNK